MCAACTLTCDSHLACLPYLNPILSYPNLIITIHLPYFVLDMSRQGLQVRGQLPPNWPMHPFLQFPDDLLDWSTFISCLIALLLKKVNIPHALSGNVADNTSLLAQLALFLTRSLWDDNSLKFFSAMGGSAGFGR